MPLFLFSKENPLLGFDLILVCLNWQIQADNAGS